MEPGDRDFVTTAATCMVLTNASAFHRRVVLPLEQWPVLILRFAKYPPELAVDARAQLAGSLLDASEKRIDINAVKFRKFFQKDLDKVRATGMLTHKLATFLNGLKTFYRADVRDCEKTNKVVSLLLERCPRIGDDLLSSRVCLKHYLGETGAGAGFQHKKFSDFRPVAEGLKNRCPGAYSATHLTFESGVRVRSQSPRVEVEGIGGYRHRARVESDRVESVSGLRVSG